MTNCFPKGPFVAPNKDDSRFIRNDENPPKGKVDGSFATQDALAMTEVQQRKMLSQQKSQPQ